jgi:hypothetical protein
MRPEILDALAGVRDFGSVTRAVLELCEPFGPVHALQMTHNRGLARVACLVELESPQQQERLVRALGAKSVNGAASIEIPVASDFSRGAAAQVL